MKLVVNIEKRHLIFFSVLLVFALGAFAIAALPSYQGVGHETLFTDQIVPQGGSFVEILDGEDDSLRIGGGGNVDDVRLVVSDNDLFSITGDSSNNYKINEFRVQAEEIKLCDYTGCYNLAQLVNPGLMNLVVCSGNPTINCGHFFDNDLLCNSIQGCSYDPETQVCSGTISNCVHQIPSPDICSNIPGCELS